MANQKNHTALHALLHALIPYTKENLQLSFHPNKFFNELERTSGYKKGTLRNAAKKAKDQGLISQEEKLLKITSEGLEKIKPFVPTKLEKNVRLMVIFDVPEVRAIDRRRFRLMLRQWRFVQVQKSVWVSKFDYRKPLIEAIKELKLESCVEIFECAKLFPRQ